jgi:asparagine synthase (glutamine-hydrolysing)
MCGIVGILGAATDERSALVRRMNASITHRGPDEEGYFEGSTVALAVRRLAIQDVTHGHQPVFDERGQIAIVFNGEIYNVRELQALLRGRGHHLKSESDSECLPHLYEEFGADFITHLRGMFTIAVWDERIRTLILARDRLGKKPLYYRKSRDGLSFGSELKALLVDPTLARVADEHAVNHYLTFQYVPAPFSAVKGVHKLQPGHILTHSSGKTQVRRYWKPAYAPAGTMSRKTDQELADELGERILDCVKVRMISERPLGAFLSGGLDSSAVVAAMSQVSSGPIKTFSIGFDDEEYNELPYARRVAERYSTEHHELIVKPDVPDILPRIASAFDEPFADSSAIPSYYLAEMASNHVIVALNGDGGDEALGGYGRYQRFLQGGHRSLPAWTERVLLRTGNSLRPLEGRSRTARKLSRGALLFADSDPARRYARFLSYFRPEEKEAVYQTDFAGQVRHPDSYGLISRTWDDYAGTDVINRLLAVDTLHYLPGDLLPKVDITTMAVSLEARSPFLDHTLVEWAAAIPGDRKLHKGVPKHLLKLALEGLIDDDLIHRQKKGFGVPLGDWLRGPLRDMVYDALTDATARSRGYFRPDRVDALLAAHMAGQDRSPHVYALLMLELWHREVLET